MRHTTRKGEGPEHRVVAEDGGHLVLLDGRPQSFVDLAEPRRLAFDYVRRAADVVDSQAAAGAPLRVVHVGGAGLSLPRYIAATRPRSSQVVLEPDEALTALVREQLPLPPRSGIRVRPVTGRDGLGTLGDGRADLVVVDAYADGRVPEDLTTLEALSAMAACLAPDGLLVLNLADQAPFALVRDVVAALALTALEDVLVSAEPPTLRGRRAGNLLVVAGREERVPRDALARAATSAAAPYRLLDRVGVASTLGGGAVRHDPGRGSQNR